METGDEGWGGATTIDESKGRKLEMRSGCMQGVRVGSDSMCGRMLG